MVCVLLTGGAGYIGSHVAVELLNHGFEVISFDNYSNSSRAALERVERITGRKVTKIYGDLCGGYHSDLDGDVACSLSDVFKAYQIDAVIHLAGLKAVGESVENPLKYYQQNIVGFLNLVAEMKTHNVKNLVFSSSATVYDASSPMPITESTPRKASNPYGQTKLMIEHMLEDLAKSDASWRIAMLRYFNPVGAHESGLIGEDPKGAPNNLMPYITRVGLGFYPCVNVFGNDYPTCDGTGVRDYIHVSDLAKGHVAALNYLPSHTGAEAFNLGTGVGTSVLEMITAFERANNVKIPVQISARRPGDAAVCYASPEKSNAILKWSATKSLDEMVCDSWRWQQTHRTSSL